MDGQSTIKTNQIGQKVFFIHFFKFKDSEKFLDKLIIYERKRINKSIPFLYKPQKLRQIKV
tara:strand:- start:1856 stop:2038 length:183 start_codon:yes stop_codon:yes gene_type:complete